MEWFTVFIAGHDANGQPYEHVSLKANERTLAELAVANYTGIDPERLLAVRSGNIVIPLSTCATCGFHHGNHRQCPLPRALPGKVGA